MRSGQFRFDSNWLREKYWNEKLSLYQMASFAGVSSVAIQYQMIKFNIPRRTRSEARKGILCGKRHPMWGKHHLPETKQKISEALTGRHLSPEVCQKMSEIRRGKHHSEDTKRKLSEGKRGNKNPNWKGGRDSKNRYVHIFKPKHPNADIKGFVPEHRLVMSEYLGHPLSQREVIHHINGDPLDNRVENLILFESQSEHRAHHALGGRR